MDTEQVLGLGEVFVLLFVTLGPPLKMPALFAARTKGLDDATCRALAWKAFGLAAVAAIVGGGLGVFMMKKWTVEPEALLLAGGIVFLIVSLRSVLEPYAAAAPPPAAPAPPGPPSAFELAFPMEVTPYGLAAIIVLLANSHHPRRTAAIIALIAVVLVLNLLAMLFAKRLTRGGGQLPLKLFGVVLGIMTVALALEMSIVALRGLSIIPTAGL
jgi:multiple antibiotic resistance protein